MSVINVLLTTLPGLGLPSTLCFPIQRDLSQASLLHLVAGTHPTCVLKDAYLTTSDGVLVSQSDTPVHKLVRNDVSNYVTTMLSLRLNIRLRGGKGGFGSQLRAAGGRMSSRKKKQNAEQATSSARNLDGRRLRTITEAKNLATYLATKPDMDRKEKEERRKRWEAVVELAEQREADMRAGKTLDGRRKGLSSEWLDEKEEVGENVKNAVKLAMAANDQDLERASSRESRTATSDSADDDSDAEEPMELDESEMARLRVEAEAGDVDALWVLQNKLRIPQDLLPKVKSQAKSTRFAGFDDDLTDSESDEETPIDAQETSKV